MANFRKVKEFVRRHPVAVSANSTIRECAEIMDRERISSVLVLKNGIPEAFFTESDLRRAIGKNVNLSRPVIDFALTKLVKISSDSSIFDALSVMVENNVKHLAIEEGGEVIGVITLRDLALDLAPKYVKYTARIHNARDLQAIKDAIENFKEELKDEAESYIKHPEIVDPYIFFSEISHVVDAMIVTASKFTSPPKSGFVYAITGSGGRKEQFLLTDRDTISIYQDREAIEWFADFEKTLDSLGFPGCEHGYTSDKFAIPYPEEDKVCSEWARNVDRNIVNISLIADARYLLGERSLLDEFKECFAEKLYRNRFVILNSLRYRPALNILGNLKETFNYKAGAVAPIEYPVRALAVTNNIFHVTNTLERIAALSEEKLIPGDMADDLEHAYTVLMRRKIWLQAQDLKEFRASKANPMERAMVKDALKTVRRFQSYIERNYL